MNKFIKDSFEVFAKTRFRKHDRSQVPQYSIQFVKDLFSRGFFEALICASIITAKSHDPSILNLMRLWKSGGGKSL